MFLVVTSVAQTPASVDKDVDAVTTPSGDAVLSFVQPGRVAKVLVKEGDSVTAGQVLIQQDDKAEQASVAQLKLVAEDDIRIKAAKATLDQKKVDLQNLKDALKNGAATQFEVEHADLDVLIADLSLDLSKFQQAQDKLKYTEAFEHLERMKLLSPFAGKVEVVRIREGESTDIQTKIMRVVKIDPLWIEVAVPRELAATLQKGQKAGVFFPQQKESTEAAVIHIGAVLDAGSDTRTVKLELPNPDGRPAGEHVKVRFSSAAVVSGGGPTSVPATSAK